MRPGAAQTPQAGFTLVELLVAFSLLLVGMAGITAMFAAGLKLERQGTLAYDAASSLDELRPRALALVRARAVASGGAVEIGPEPVPGRPGLSWRARAVPAPGAPEGSTAWMMKIEVFPNGARDEDAFGYGWMPVRLAPTQDELVRRAAEAGD